MVNKLSAFAVFVIILFSVSFTAFAASETKDIFTLDGTYNIAVSILFDKEKPEVSFTAPNGRVYGGASLRSDSGDGWVQYYIPNAIPGTWQITYDKLSNTRFEISYFSYLNPLSVTEFSMGAVDGDYIPVRFAAQSEADGNYQYKLYAVIIDDNGVLLGEQELADGIAKTGDVVKRDVYIGNLQNYSNYTLRLDIWQKTGVEETYDSAIADGSFAVSGRSTYEPIQDFFTKIDLTDGVISVDWSNWAKYGAGYIIAFFDEAVSAAEPFYFSEITTGETYASAIFDPAATDSLRVDLTYGSGSMLSETRTKTIKVDTGIKFTWTVGEHGNSAQAVILYETPENLTADVTVNNLTDKVRLTGSGSFSVALPDFYNEISISYSLDDPNTIYVVHLETAVDKTPPILRLPENKTAVRVDAGEYVLAGVTEPGASVSVGGAAVNVNDDGTFICTIKLADGENIIPVTATDASGNIALQNVVIIRSSIMTAAGAYDRGFWSGVLRCLPLIGSFIASIVLLVLVIVFSNAYNKSRETSGSLALFSLLRNIFLVLLIISACATGFIAYKYFTLNARANSEKLFETAKDSVTEAFELIKDAALFKEWLIKGVIATLVFLLLFAGFLFIVILKKNKLKKSLNRTEQSNEMICPNCGARYDKPVKFCGKCGAKL